MAFYQPKKPGEENNDVFNGFSASAGDGQVDTSVQPKSQFGSLMSYLDSQSPKFDQSKTGISQVSTAGRAADPIKESPKYETSLQMADSSAPVQRVQSAGPASRMDTISAAREQAMGGGNFRSHDASGQQVASTGVSQTRSNPLVGSNQRQGAASQVISNPLMGPSLSHANADQRIRQEVYGLYNTQIQDLGYVPTVPYTPEVNTVVAAANAKKALIHNPTYSAGGQASGTALPSSDALHTKFYNMSSAAQAAVKNNPQLLATFFSDKNLKTDINEMSDEDITNILNDLSGVK